MSPPVGKTLSQHVSAELQSGTAWRNEETRDEMGDGMLGALYAIKPFPRRMILRSTTTMNTGLVAHVDPYAI